MATQDQVDKVRALSPDLRSDDARLPALASSTSRVAPIRKTRGKPLPVRFGRRQRPSLFLRRAGFRSWRTSKVTFRRTSKS